MAATIQYNLEKMEPLNMTIKIGNISTKQPQRQIKKNNE